ncbi:hypothetical protein [Janthinobacterium agaricidamnosum]|uniref:hypothetical protein n=1 Tax=Janthinobacterium agaricidamnosum TaxID=55508 RepID=UPI001184A8D0|nr:hypothetical protein [Janthinobacterium agaricidamnosum]
MAKASDKVVVRFINFSGNQKDLAAGAGVKFTLRLGVLAASTACLGRRPAVYSSSPEPPGLRRRTLRGGGNCLEKIFGFQGKTSKEWRIATSLKTILYQFSAKKNIFLFYHLRLLNNKSKPGGLCRMTRRFCLTITTQDTRSSVAIMPRRHAHKDRSIDGDHGQRLVCVSFHIGYTTPPGDMAKCRHASNVFMEIRTWLI